MCKLGETLIECQFLTFFWGIIVVRFTIANLYIEMLLFTPVALAKNSYSDFKPKILKFYNFFFFAMPTYSWSNNYLIPCWFCINNYCTHCISRGLHMQIVNCWSYSFIQTNKSDSVPSRTESDLSSALPGLHLLTVSSTPVVAGGLQNR